MPISPGSRIRRSTPTRRRTTFSQYKLTKIAEGNGDDTASHFEVCEGKHQLTELMIFTSFETTGDPARRWKPADSKGARTPAATRTRTPPRARASGCGGLPRGQGNRRPVDREVDAAQQAPRDLEVTSGSHPGAGSGLTPSTLPATTHPILCRSLPPPGPKPTARMTGSQPAPGPWGGVVAAHCLRQLRPGRGRR